MRRAALECCCELHSAVAVPTGRQLRGPVCCPPATCPLPYPTCLSVLPVGRTASWALPASMTTKALPLLQALKHRAGRVHFICDPKRCSIVQQGATRRLHLRLRQPAALWPPDSFPSSHRLTHSPPRLGRLQLHHHPSPCCLTKTNKQVKPSRSGWSVASQVLPKNAKIHALSTHRPSSASPLPCVRDKNEPAAAQITTRSSSFIG